MATTSAPVTEDPARTREEERLARRAADGDGAAFATLYDRYERRIFNYCLRLLNSPDDASDATQDAFLKVLQRLPKLGDRDLNFSAYLYTAARNASYDMIGRRKKAEPVDEIPESGMDARELGAIDEDPERALLLDSFQADVQDANARLPERHREVLVMREVDELSYDEIAEIMDMNRNSVAQLISRARIKLRDELRGTALASIAVSSPECEKALPLIAMRQDSQLKKAEDREWLDTHLATCETCKVSVEAMQEAGVSYRAWLPIVPLEFLRRATIAKASEQVGADWSEYADAGRPGGDGSPSSGDHPAAGTPDATEALHPVDGAGRGGLLHLPASWMRRNAHAAGEEDGKKRRKRGLLLGVIAALLLLAGVTAVVSGSGDTPATDEPVGEEAASTSDGGSSDASGTPTANGGDSAGASNPGGLAGGGKPGTDGKGATPLTAVPFLPGVKVKPDGTVVRTPARRGGKKPSKSGGSKNTSTNSGGSNNSGGGSKRPSKKPTRTPSSNNGGGGNSTPSGGGGNNGTPSGGGGSTTTDQPVSQSDPPAQSDPTPPTQDPPTVADPTPPSTNIPGSTERPTPSGTGNPTVPSSGPPTRDPGGSTPTTPPRCPTRRC